MLFRTPVLIAALLCSSVLATAAQVTLDATDYGFRIDSGGPFTSSIVLGWCPCDPISELRNYFVFDLSSISGVITAAQLQLDMPAPSGQLPVGGYDSPQATETFQVNEVTSTIAQVLDPFANVAVYTDLGDGTALGSVVLNPASEGTLVVIPLNGSALALLNNQAGGQIALGGSVTTLAKAASNELVFAGNGGPAFLRQLVLTVESRVEVPEPGTLWLAAGILLPLLVRRFRAAP
ncbi:MAG: hypothetical protein ACRD8O_15595 [Bryobacteraceae bacterium]